MMLSRVMLLVLILVLLSSVQAFTVEDLRFCLEREYKEVMIQNDDAIVSMAMSQSADEQSLLAIIEYAKLITDASLAADCHYQLASRFHRIDSAIQWILLYPALLKVKGITEEEYQVALAALYVLFPSEADTLALDIYSQALSEEQLMPRVKAIRHYNTIIEEMAKAAIDEISVISTDSIALGKIATFRENFPHSAYAQAVLYFELYHLINSGNTEAAYSILQDSSDADASLTYVKNVFRLSSELRKNLDASRQSMLLQLAFSSCEGLLDAIVGDRTYKILYDSYPACQFANKVQMLMLKSLYYQTLQSTPNKGEGLFPIAILKKPNSTYKRMLGILENITFAHNDSGDIAEYLFWKANVEALLISKKSLIKAAKTYTMCLEAGAPRKKYDVEAFNSVSALQKRLKVKGDTFTWMRKLMNYKGPIFEDITQKSGIADKTFTRVALADYDNDGHCDILFNGSKLYRNDGKANFSDVSESSGLGALVGSGGLFADFNRDGLLDFVSISHSSDGMGERLMKNMDNKRFAAVNERAGDIDDGFPSEGAAWVDTELSGYPSLYVANYEKWQVQSGYPDLWWENDKGYFSDKSVDRGFRHPPYADNPGLAGRGVAPADFNNDGVQDILVTNYRLGRNFLWMKAGEQFYDLASQFNLHGKEVYGYYGHSIGADWGDYDNDGDLDLFIANLAHPRYIEFSDISMLLRNDGLQSRVVAGDTLYYWQFTDVTKAAGITFDELHSDPTWFDADNDGLLDLFITSVYANDRSYLYRNNGDGTFTDITWLSGTRVYNGWGNASADLDGDGKLDLVVGSGNGTKILRNASTNKNQSVFVRPIHADGEIMLLYGDNLKMAAPNSPAFGVRVELISKDRKGKLHSQIQELRSAKGTTSQCEPILHFGLGNRNLVQIKRVRYEND